MQIVSYLSEFSNFKSFYLFGNNYSTYRIPVHRRKVPIVIDLL